MTTTYKHTPAAVDHVQRRCELELRADIRYLEGRLTEMGLGGDCAYERALAKTFVELLSQRRRSLARIRPDVAGCGANR